MLTGTTSPDVILPFDGNSTVYADPPGSTKGGNDDVRHSFGDDTIYGGPGKDLIDCAYLEPRADDTGDTAYADREDAIVDCKDVYDDPITPYL